MYIYIYIWEYLTMNTSAPCCWTMQGHLAQNSCMTFQTSKCCYPPQKNASFVNFLEINSLPLKTFQRPFFPSSPKASPLPFSLTIFTMNEFLQESILFLQITWFFFNTTQRLKDIRCILAYHRSSPVGWFPVWIHSLVWILPHPSVPEWWPVLLESPKSVRKSATTLHS